MAKIDVVTFVGSVGWLIFWIIVCWPIAIIYYFMNREMVELKLSHKKN